VALTEAKLRRRLFRIMVRAGGLNRRTAARRARELARFLARRSR